MAFDFEFILTLLVIILGLIYLLDVLVLAKRRAVANRPNIIVEYTRAFFPVLLVVLLLRTFVFEPYRIPSGSDKPTLLIGDFIVVNKFTYGLRLPVLHTKIKAFGEPAHGDIVVFREPNDPSMILIKRVIGLPGDRVSYIDKTLYINGKAAAQTALGATTDHNGDEPMWPVQIKAENLLGINHQIYLRPDIPADNFSLMVPAGQYFVMGDNRDNSKDSRYWGFLPEANLVGRAVIRLFSIDEDHYTLRWSRTGTRIQ